MEGRDMPNSDTNPTALHIFGIKACDTMKKARAFLDERGVPYIFHDYKAEGVTAERLTDWAAKVGWEKLVNRAGTTFRQLSDEAKTDLDEAKAIALMIANPSLIKRPVLIRGDEILVGFKAEAYQGMVG
jgi:arsenate reductase